jgi:hypothetical protein
MTRMRTDLLGGTEAVFAPAATAADTPAKMRLLGLCGGPRHNEVTVSMARLRHGNGVDLRRQHAQPVRPGRRQLCAASGILPAGASQRSHALRNGRTPGTAWRSASARCLESRPNPKSAVAFCSLSVIPAFDIRARRVRRSATVWRDGEESRPTGRSPGRIRPRAAAVSAPCLGSVRLEIRPRRKRPGHGECSRAVRVPRQRATGDRHTSL